jgi:hypothetical protein
VSLPGCSGKCLCLYSGNANLLSNRFYHIFQSNAVTVLLWRQHRLLPIPSQVSYSDHLAINTVPSRLLTPTNPENKIWKQRQIENYSCQMILGTLMTTVFVDEMVSYFVKYLCFFCDAAASTRAMSSLCLWFFEHTQRRTTVGSNPLDEWSARRRDFYLTIHNTHNRQTSMPPVGFELTISTGERPRTTP